MPTAFKYQVLGDRQPKPSEIQRSWRSLNFIKLGLFYSREVTG
ncbi:hypothetical protein [Phormidium pseudopriestleyi]|nr:hypothetical protein [Phormidium pseudopriestleyi]